MTSLTLGTDATSPTLTTATTTADVPRTSASSSTGYSAGLEADLRQASVSGVNGLLVGSLGAALKLLDERLDAVSWPETASANSSANLSASSSGGSPSGTSCAGSGGASADCAASAEKTTGAATAEITALDLSAHTTLAPGTYTLDYMAGEASSAASGAGGRVLIHIYSTDTWQDVLLRLARALGTASTGMFSRLVPVSASAIRTPPKAEGRALADSVAGVLDSYNEVGGLLARQATAAGKAVAEDWARAAATRADALSSVGVERTDQDLWLAEAAFLDAVWSRPQEAQAALCGADGLFTVLKARVADMPGALAGGLADASGADATADAAVNATANAAPDLLAAPDSSGPTRTEAQVERSNRLLDVYDADAGTTSFSLDALGLGESGGLVRRRG